MICEGNMLVRKKWICRYNVFFPYFQGVYVRIQPRTLKFEKGVLLLLFSDVVISRHKVGNFAKIRIFKSAFTRLSHLKLFPK